MELYVEYDVVGNDDRCAAVDPGDDDADDDDEYPRDDDEESCVHVMHLLYSFLRIPCGDVHRRRVRRCEGHDCDDRRAMGGSCRNSQIRLAP